LAGFVSIAFIKSVFYVGVGFSGVILAPSLVLGELLGGILGVAVNKVSRFEVPVQIF
jgi:H+/Cl- antiporter ClcA